MNKSLREIREASTNKNDTAFLLKIGRPLGYYLAWLFIRIGLLPIQITLFNLFLGITICLMFAWLGPAYRILAATLLVFWEILDTTDGNMARVLKIRSNYGGFIDFAGGMFLLTFLQLNIGIGLYFYPDNSAQALFQALGVKVQYLPQYTLIFAAYSSAAATLSRLLHRIIQIRFGKEMFKEDEGRFEKLSLGGKLLRFIRNVENLGGFQIVFIFMASLLRCMEVLVLFYFLLNLAMLVGYTTRTFISLRHSHDYL